MVPANGPTPPTTATITPSQSGIVAAPHGVQAEQRHDDPADAVAPAEHVLRAVQAGHDPHDQQARVDRRVGEREVLERRAGSMRTRGGCRPRSCSSAASAAAAVRVVRPVGRVGRPPLVRVVLVVAHAARRPRRATPGRPGTPCRRAWRSAPRPSSRSGTTPHSSSQLAASAPAGSSPASTAPPAPSAHMPAHVATQPARRPASQRPSGSRTTHSTDSAPDGAVDQPQRPAHRCSSSRSSPSRAS